MAGLFSRRGVLGGVAGGLVLGGLALAGPGLVRGQGRGGVVAAAGDAGSSGAEGGRQLLPRRLARGDAVGLVNPASARFETIPKQVMADSLVALGLQPRQGAHYHDRRGYFAGRDEDRAADINGFFADPQIRAIWATGGWGSARLLPLLDYDLIRANPKVFVGYSDATALLNGIYARTGLVTFHGPFPINRVTAGFQRRLLLEGEEQVLANPSTVDRSKTVQTAHRTLKLHGGRARGRLLGGNLAVLSAIVGSAYLPDFDGAILILEDINESVYRIDRMLTQLRLAGILQRLAGLVFGACVSCGPGDGFGSLTLEEVLADHVAPLRIPAWQGAMFGHLDEQFTLPVGREVEIDADAATLRIPVSVS